MLNSLAKIDHSKIGYGDSLNMRFPHFLVSSDKNLEVFEHLIDTYFEKGGMHVQVNTMGTELLRDAQTHPEKYEDLIIRVSGYAAYFTRLGKEIQNDIIERVEFTNI
jgi:formate C-acetyltransferase